MNRFSKESVNFFSFYRFRKVRELSSTLGNGTIADVYSGVGMHAGNKIEIPIINSRYKTHNPLVIVENFSGVRKIFWNTLYYFSYIFSIFLIILPIIAPCVYIYFYGEYVDEDTKMGMSMLWGSIFSPNLLLLFPDPEGTKNFIKILRIMGGLYRTLFRQSMESLGFEKSFDAFSRDPVEARMIITPAFMDRLEEFSNKWDLKGKIRIIWEKDTFTLLLKGDIEQYGKESDGSYTLVKSMEEMLNLSYYSLSQTNTNNL